MEIAEGGAGSDDAKERLIAELEERHERDNKRIALLEERLALKERHIAVQQEEIAVPPWKSAEMSYYKFPNKDDYLTSSSDADAKEDENAGQAEDHELAHEASVGWSSPTTTRCSSAPPPSTRLSPRASTPASTW